MPEEEPYDAGNPSHVRRAIRESKRWDDRRSDVITLLMSNPDGRRWVHETLVLCHVGANPFANESTHKTAFNCGELNIGQQLMAQVIGAAPKLYLQMMDEANKPEQETGAETEQ